MIFYEFIIQDALRVVIVQFDDRHIIVIWEFDDHHFIIIWQFDDHHIIVIWWFHDRHFIVIWRFHDRQAMSMSIKIISVSSNIINSEKYPLYLVLN